ncbi:hypothetical protein RDWZM_006322 [Blomia tropicalis]|uniref:MACPF domain-containing protein n=1 Tax=Blomia tropicalis TaxID=40697 RepID=A0A9Q0RNF8_BLOTA|nr:hypothetical protein RDWZM_006322 [Blomia tropicalis]
MQLRLSPYFESSIDKLPARYEDNPEQYDLLINIFGTHYFEIAKFGGYLYQKTIIENNYLEQSRKEEISANLKLSFDGFFKLGVNMNAEYNQVTEESKKKFSSNTQKNFYNYGGTTKFSTDPDKNYIGKWWSTINKDPWLFGGQLRPIENLVRNATIKREVAKAALLKRIRSYLTDFQNSIKMTPVELNEESKKMLTEIDQYLNNNPSWDARDVLSHGKDIKKLFDRMRIYYDEIKMKAEHSGQGYNA